jgi:predicted metal-dependent hydrolase
VKSARQLQREVDDFLRGYRSQGARGRAHAKKIPPARGDSGIAKKIPPEIQTRAKSDLRASIQRLLDKWQPRLGITVDKWNLRKMKKYWGSSRRPGCDQFACRDGHITFNTDMAKLPERHQEYLVVHELVHQVTDGHDAKFYSLMDRHLPGWREMQAQIEEPLTRYS